LKYCKALIKLNIENGEVIEKINSGTFEYIYEIDSNYIFINTFKGKYSVLNTDIMQIYKTYNLKAVNPFNTLSLIIDTVNLKNNQLKITGVEEISYNIDVFANNKRCFERIIDNNFYNI